MNEKLHQDMIQLAVKKGLGTLTRSGVFTTTTGKYTGRATQQRFLASDPKTDALVDWGEINRQFPSEKTQRFLKALKARLQHNESYAFQGFAGPFAVSVTSSSPWHIAFCANMFRDESFQGRPPQGEAIRVWHDPFVRASDLLDDYKDEALIVLDLAYREVGIVGTAYAGEIKKSVFTTCNFWAPEYNSFPMHASANCLEDGSSSCVLFGLSGTGKTTLSASSDRALIGDDEIIWGEQGLYNLEGGCYAKLIDLKREKEPEIFEAVHSKLAILENVVLDSKGDVEFENRSLTENTRGSYPLKVLPKVFDQSRIASHPENVVFLTADAFGALPAVARLSLDEAEYFFISGYTAKVAGTELGVKEPRAVFSACFGAPFMPRPAKFYASLLRKKVEESGAKVWLLNTGWTQGGYGVGERFPIHVSRSLLQAIQSGSLNHAPMQKHPVFGFEVPTQVEGVDSQFLGLGDLKKSEDLKKLFEKNFVK